MLLILPVYGLLVFLSGEGKVHNHMLRHSFATRMREAGTNIKATANILDPCREYKNIYDKGNCQYECYSIAVYHALSNSH